VLQDDGSVQVVERPPRAPADRSAFVLAVAPPRPARLEWLVEKACELGVAELVLLRTAHAERIPGDGRLARLERISDEALLQCRRLYRMPVHPPLTVHELLARPRDGTLWLGVPPPLGEPAGAPAEAPVAPPPRPARDGPLLGLVGPEGGFLPEEERLIRDAGATPIALGRTVLRVETAAVALAVLAAV
jgi:16S rRNA (uracil1498-N3)-methyltransferase